VKVLTRGGRSLRDVARHLKYLDRDGDVAIEADTGERLRGPDAAADLLADWDLDLDAPRRRGGLGAGFNRDTSKLVHKVVLSMPAGTPPEKVLVAVRNLMREEFALKHRYAMVLHTNEPHPHVHVLVKVLGNDGRRCTLRKATLRSLRQAFATSLVELGVDARATQRGHGCVGYSVEPPRESTHEMYR
jgi:hypothetical protein